MDVVALSLKQPEFRSLGSSHRSLTWCFPEESLALAFGDYLAEQGVSEALHVCTELVGGVHTSLHYVESEMNDVVFACWLVAKLYRKQQALEQVFGEINHAHV